MSTPSSPCPCSVTRSLPTTGIRPVPCSPASTRTGPGTRSTHPGLLLLSVLLLLGMAFVSPNSLYAQTTGNGERNHAGEENEGTEANLPGAVRTLEAVRVDGSPPVIDGDLSDPIWELAPLATDFVQMEPHEGAPATERTEARILYDDEAIYVAIRAYDSQPDSIAAQLTRRDQESYSDRVHVVIDSYFDRRTAFHFAVNPVGVKADWYRYEDHRQDGGWEAVWDVATRIDDEGWTAEFRIPLSQLRFSGAAEQNWGINFGRELARKTEISSWSPLPAREQAFVSRAGILHGIRDLQPGHRIELLPYSAAQVARVPGDGANPYWDPTDGQLRVGVDLRMGVTSNLTMDITANPDFGQVEADPGQVNLTAFETFLPERRPFFQEGAGIFRFGIGIGDGDGENQTLFYSRRIGRSPQGSLPSSADWRDAPSRTRILSAGKLSGKTESGWSVGFLSAITGSEEGRAMVDGQEMTMEVEPMTNYSVARIQRDLRGGESSLGGIATATFRDGSGADALGLRQDAYTGGVDGRHRFMDGTMELRGYLLGSRVSGSPEAIAATQRSSARYFQRPDAHHLDYDPTATSMAGWSGALEYWRMGGGPWRFATLTHLRSPGFEVNDLGFMPRSDYIAQVGYVGYMENEPGRHLRRWGLNTNIWSSWNFGGDHQEIQGNVNGQITTNGNRSAWSGIRVSGEGLNPTLLRGGPAFRTERAIGGWGGVGTDPRQNLQLNVNTNWEVRPESDSWVLSASPNLRWRPSERMTLRVAPSYTRRVEDRQWMGALEVEGAPHYLFGRMKQSTFATTLRGEMSVTPNLSVQLYAQPFMSAGEFQDFRRIQDPRASSYEDRFQTLEVEDRPQGYQIHFPGTDQARNLDNPDFRALQFRSNAVLRWEYRPGSTLYLVWGQARDQFQNDGEFHVGRGFDDIFSTLPENVFMLKMSYWFTP